MIYKIRKHTINTHFIKRWSNLCGKAVVMALLMFGFGKMYGQNMNADQKNKGFNNRFMERGDIKFKEKAYADAGRYYGAVADFGYESEELYKKLGDSHFFNADYEKACVWYAKLFQYSPKLTDSAYYMRYYTALRATGRHKESLLWSKKFQEQLGLESLAAKGLSDNNVKKVKNSKTIEVKTTHMNSIGSDFGGAVVQDQLVFASNRDLGGASTYIDAWTGEHFYDLYSMPTEGSKKPKKLKGDVNTKYHESSAVFTKDGNTMYFTRSNTKAKKKSLRHLKIYRAEKVKGKWRNVEDLAINGDHFSTAHPALDTNAEYLYFASDRPGSLGGTDLYKVAINADGSMGSPIHLGEPINTVGRESFPFISEQNVLYFSSDSHTGMGGYDVYAVVSDSVTGVTNLKRLAAPINSKFDDVAFSLNGNKGFVSSKRNSSLEHDNIYQFDFDENADVLTGNNFSDQKDSLVITEKKEVAATQNDNLTTTDTKAVSPTANDNLVLSLVINHEFDSWLFSELDREKLRAMGLMLKENPEQRLYIVSHTDNVGTMAYNKVLSDKRAQNIKQYFIKLGVSEKRIKSMGVGEMDPLIDCDGSAGCTKKQHAKNRRSEVDVILKK